jgi:glycosyltransferase involved in cell wall biosynthesis
MDETTKETKRIAINALAINVASSGGRTYLLNLLEELLYMAGSEYRFYLLCTPKNAPMFAQFRSTSLDLVVFPRITARTLGRVVWEQVALPFWLWRNCIDLLFAARNVIPILAPCPTVVGVLSMHLNYESKEISWWRRLLGSTVLRLSAQRAAAHLAISEYAGRTYIKEYELSTDRLFVAPLGHRFTSLSGQDPAPDSLPAEYILFVGTLFPHKNLTFLLRAFGPVSKARPSTKLVIAGRDVNDSRKALEKLVLHLDLADRVLFLGQVSDQQLARLYANARVFVFPSLVEGFGLPILEAMAHAVPVIASDRTSLPEVVGDAGIVLDPTTEKVWSETMLRVLQDESLHSALSQKGVARAAAFTWRRTAEKTLACFRVVLESSWRRPRQPDDGNSI